MSKLLELTKNHKKSLALGGITLSCALGIGYIMQYGMALPGQHQALIPTMEEIAVTGVTPTSSGNVGAARSPMAEDTGTTSPAPAALADAPALAMMTGIPAITPRAAEPKPEAQSVITLAAADDSALENMAAPSRAPAPVASCGVSMTAEATAGAMVDLTLSAPCNGSERVTLHHQGMMFTDVTDASGNLDVTVPALAENALFIASFASGDGATAMTEVSSLPFYDRVVVQWKGDAGLGLHAREFTEEYFGPGHVWSGAAGDLGAAAKGIGGFMTALGHSDAPDALRAEVYTFPTGTAQRDGDVHLTVEAEITATNCDTPVEAQTLELRADAKLRTRNLTLDMPDCARTGDFLVLKNLVEDLTIAAR
ncbi:hypothetical protein [Sagittula stellata]|uniref:Translocase n=1 Tax=Sagittula stellata (strain ATCC 700073 / DSM 11524 / E-37) TaxID=388399 RepID=A3KAU0_SAGS3|nr:hypothetical protein [Sagittula stellata]EBA05736.1 hypothetical protein SSE37_18447 [Sagittula stellata E-37]